VTPKAGAKEARQTPQLSAAVIGFWGDCAAPRTKSAGGGGEPKSVIDSKRRRLQCLRPAVLGGHENGDPCDTAKGHEKAVAGSTAMWKLLTRLEVAWAAHLGDRSLTALRSSRHSRGVGRRSASASCAQLVCPDDPHQVYVRGCPEHVCTAARHQHTTLRSIPKAKLIKAPCVSVVGMTPYHKKPMPPEKTPVHIT
jgi:hypothetical protein